MKSVFVAETRRTASIIFFNALIIAVCAFSVSDPLNAGVLDVARAEESDYIEINSGNVPFYDATPRKTAVIFTLPESYFVKLIDDMTDDEEAPYYYVEYGGKSGLVFVSDLKGAAPAANATVAEYGESPSIKLRINSAVTARGYDAVNLKPAAETEIKNSSDLTFSYLGKHTINGAAFLFVKNDLTKEYLYISETAFAAFTLPAHKVTQDRIIAEEEQKTDKNKPIGDVPGTNSPSKSLKDDDVLRYLIIAGISVPALLIFILMFKPSKHGKRDSYNRDHDRRNSRYDDRRRYEDDRRTYSRRDDRDYEYEDYDRRYDRRGYNRYRDSRNDYGAPHERRSSGDDDSPLFVLVDVYIVDREAPAADVYPRAAVARDL
ncbi:MAG: hypothetical protein LBC13_01635, partial [Clostridiales bacterium]|nr:hypothetical protein [Clostridiales bacterium]